MNVPILMSEPADKRLLNFQVTRCSGLMSNLRYLCLFAHSGVQHIYCVVLLFCLSTSCVPYVASFSELFIFDWPFGIL